ncbi:MAG: DUF1992 domain-containing protein [Betaproteobacteria bacterium]
MFDRIVDRKIREAMAEGAFDDLEGHGRPIDLEDYFATPEHLRMAHSILKSAGCLPEEIELLNEIASLERQMASTHDPQQRAQLAARLADVNLRVRLLLERVRRK